MSQHKPAGLEIPNNSLILRHSLANSSHDSEKPCTEACGSGPPPEPPEPPVPQRKRPPMAGEFWFNHQLISIDELLIVDSRRRNGLILFKRYHAEFAGPGSAVGGEFDQDCHLALPLGNLSLLRPTSADERQRAYLIRRQWIRLTKQITDNIESSRRAQMILNQFQYYFDAKTIAQLPDEALALLVGVLPETIRKARDTSDNSD